MSIFLPELALILMALIFFIMSLAKPKAAPKISLVQTMALIMAVIVFFITILSYKSSGVLFFNAYKIDAFSQVFKIILSFGFLIVVALGSGVKSGLKGINKELAAEYYMFLTLSVTGLVFLTSSVELLTIVISLEISSFALYVIIPFRYQDGYKKQMEAGIKYVMFGAVATGISLYGMSYIFGMAHTTYLDELGKILPDLVQGQAIVIFGLILMLASFFYKLAMFPMHFWAPDVYEGSANETAGFIATLPKVGAVALLLRLVALAGVETTQVTWILGTLAVLSMTIGNLSALVQKDIKRLIAYSSIAHAGYIMIAVLCANNLGYEAAIYYIAGYILMNLALFYVVYNVSENGENVSLDNLNGLYKRSPILALLLAIAAFGMAGMPPTIGFLGKFMIFTAAISKPMYAIVILAVINAGIAAYYYLKMVRAAYINHEEELPAIKLGFPKYIFGIFFIFSILAAGIFPQSLMELARTAVSTIF
jgi:NADH-quinone oxidoreductase subunit N